jgi:thymidylate synthase (FAD)
MSYQYETHENAPVRAGFIEAQKGFSRTAYNLYNTLLKLGIAKEQARSVLPLNLYTRFMWGIDLRNLTNFLVLRNDKHAQLEIQHAAQAVESAFEEVCPVTYRIWNEEGRPRLAGID